MKPLWVIDLRDGRHERLEQCLASIGQAGGRKWIYTRFDRTAVPDSVAAFARVRDELVEEAKRQVNRLLQEVGLNTGTFHICVLGDITAARTRALLPFLSMELKRNWVKVLPMHIGMGVSVETLCYVPTVVNQHGREQQCEYARFLKELAWLHKRIPAEMYDLMVVYGDVQPVGRQAFTQLDDGRLDELAFQYLLNLYHTGTGMKLSVTAEAANCLFVNLGAVSCFYDADYTRKRVARELLKTLLGLFTRKADEADPTSETERARQRETTSLLETAFLPHFVTGESILKSVACNETDLTADLKSVDKESGWHPVYHFWNPWLYPSYYLRYLRRLPARLHEYLQFYTRSLRKLTGQRLQLNSKTAFENTCKTLETLLAGFRTNTTYQYKTLGQVERLLQAVAGLADAERGRLEGLAAAGDVSPVRIPDFLLPHVEEINLRGTEADFNHMLDDLKKALQKEPTFLGAMVRCLLVGTAGVFCILPLLKFLSPDIINLGDVMRYEYVWMSLIYALPFAITLWWGFYRHFRLVKQLKNRLWAYVLMQLKGELTHRMVEEAQQYYVRLKEYCEQKLAECDRLRKVCEVNFEVESSRFEETFFNRSVDDYVSDKSLLEEKVEVDGSKQNVGKLGEEAHYHLLAALLMEGGAAFFAPLPEKEEDLRQAVDHEVGVLFEALQERFAKNAETEIHRLAAHCLSDGDWQALLERAFPVGVFVDGISYKEICTLRAVVPLHVPEEAGQLRQEEDPEGDRDILFITSYCTMDGLALSRFLSAEVPDEAIGMDFSVELACYYATASAELKYGVQQFAGKQVNSSRLQEIAGILSQ